MSEVNNGDHVLYKQREHKVIHSDGSYILLKDIKNHEKHWVLRTLVQKIEKR